MSNERIIPGSDGKLRMIRESGAIFFGIRDSTLDDLSVDLAERQRAFDSALLRLKKYLTLLCPINDH